MTYSKEQLQEVELFCIELLKKFNINTENIYSFNLCLKANEFPVITIEQYAIVNDKIQVHTNKLKLTPIENTIEE